MSIFLKDYVAKKTKISSHPRKLHWDVWMGNTYRAACLLELLPTGVFGKKLYYLGLGFHPSEMSEQEMAHILWFSSLCEEQLGYTES